MPNIYKSVLLPYVSTIKEMNNVVHQELSTTIKPGLNASILHFKKYVEVIGLSETLKMHYIIHHIPYVLHYLNGADLGLWSEQAGESIHRIFSMFWDKYKI